MGHLNNLADLIPYIVLVSAQELADVDDHVQFRAAIRQGLLCFRNLDGRAVRAVGEANHRAHLHIAAPQQGGYQRHIAGPGADAGRIIAQGQLAALADILVGQERLKGAVVQHFGNVMGCKPHRKNLLDRIPLFFHENAQ